MHYFRDINISRIRYQVVFTIILIKYNYVVKYIYIYIKVFLRKIYIKNYIKIIWLRRDDIMAFFISFNLRFQGHFKVNSVFIFKQVIFVWIIVLIRFQFFLIFNNIFSHVWNLNNIDNQKLLKKDIKDKEIFLFN